MFREARPSGKALMLPAAPDGGLPYRRPQICPLMADEHAIGYLGVVEVGTPVQPVDVEAHRAGRDGAVTDRHLRAPADGGRGSGPGRNLSPISSTPSGIRRCSPGGHRCSGSTWTGPTSWSACPSTPIPASRAAHAVWSRAGSVPRSTVPSRWRSPCPAPTSCSWPCRTCRRRRRWGGSGWPWSRCSTRSAARSGCGGRRYHPVCGGSSSYPKAHRELRAVLEATRAVAGEGPRVVLAGDLGVMRLVVAGTGGESRQFALELLGPLARYDRGERLGTASHAGRLPPLRRRGAAHRPGSRRPREHRPVHRGRIGEISAADPNELGGLLDAHLALQILELTDASSPSL